MDFSNVNFEGFQRGNQEMMESLFKALSAGTGIDPTSFTGGRALTPESLDTTLVNVLWKQDEARLFKALKKQPVKSPVHQWVRRTDVGGSDGAWVPEGGDSQEANQTIARAWAVMKYLQTLRKVTLQATITNMIEDAIALEKQAGTLWIIKQIEMILFDGNSAIIDEQPDGLKKLITGTDNVIDIRGKTANSSQFEAAIPEGCRVIRSKFGMATDLFCSLMVMTDVQALLKDRIRFEAKREVLGSAVFTEYPTPFAVPKLVDDIFIQEGQIGTASLITASRPSQPTITLARAAASPLVSQFVAGDAGDYYYQVASINKYGLSQLSAAVQVTGVQALDKVTISVTNEGATPGTGFVLFRSKKGAADGTDCREFNRVVRTGATPDIIDLNADLPGTSSAYLLNLDTMYDAIEWEQFLPLMKFDLYPTNAAVYPFLMLLFGALGLKKPEHHIRIKNISTSKQSWF